MKHYMFFSFLCISLFYLVSPHNIFAAGPCIDNDGDGWGWNGVESCRMNSTSTPSALSSPSTSSTPVCQSQNSDSDNDGWGWENGRTCVSQNTQNSSTGPGVTSSYPATNCVDHDGDGWGWDGVKSCQTSEQNASNNTQSNNTLSEFNNCQLSGSDDNRDGWGWENGASCISKYNSLHPNYNSSNSNSAISSEASQTEISSQNTSNNSSLAGLEQVTDVIVTAGQSNALGEGSLYNTSLDTPHDRVFVWTVQNGWQKANLTTQIWWKGRVPAPNRPLGSRPENYGRGQNHGGFQIAKEIAKTSPSRVIALIATGDAGMPISNWDEGSVHYTEMTQKIKQAMDALPRKNEVDLIWWMQGESDSEDSPYYENKLYDLLRRFKEQDWFSNRGYFIANETAKHRINSLFRRLDWDNDPKTCFSTGQNLPTDIDGIHFTAEAFRLIGQYVAAKYLNQCKATN